MPLIDSTALWKRMVLTGLLLLACLAVLVVLLSVPVHIGRCLYTSLDQDHFYPVWVNVAISVVVAVITGALWTGFLLLAVAFLTLLCSRPWATLGIVALLVLWVFAFGLELLSAFNLPDLPENAAVWMWIVIVICVPLGIVQAIWHFIERFESNDWTSALDRLSGDNGIHLSPAGSISQYPRIKYQGDGFVILDVEETAFPMYHHRTTPTDGGGLLSGEPLSAPPHSQAASSRR